MEWERKFSTIVHETEANLDRVRRRLEAAKTSTDVEVLGVHSASLPSYKSASSLLQKASSVQTANAYSHTMNGGASTQPPIWATVLDEKFAKQQKVIDSLRETVISLQLETERQKATIEELNETISTLQQSTEEKESSLNDVQGKIQQLKLETNHQLNTLKQQVQHKRQSGLNTAISQPSIEHLQTQVKDTRNLCRDEAESAKKDIDYYKTRMTRLEKNISGLNEELADLTRRQNDLRVDVSNLNDRYRSDYRELSSCIRERQADINITRNELSALKADVTDSAPMQRSPRPQIVTSRNSSKVDKPLMNRPAQWRDLLSHSLSTLSVESSDSTLSSGYLARRRSQDSNLDEPGMSLKQPRTVSPSLLYYQTDKPLLFIILIWLSYVLALVLLVKSLNVIRGAVQLS